MNNRSPNFTSPRFIGGGTPRSNQHCSRPPLYLQPNSPYMSPRATRMTSPRHSSSPDFIPLGISSPVNRAKQRWSNQSINSSYSSFGNSPPNFNSSQFSSPYKRHGFRGNFRGRIRSSNSSYSGSNSPHISSYVDKECLQNPWAELERQLPAGGLHIDSESAQNVSDSDSDSSDSDGDES